MKPLLSKAIRPVIWALFAGLCITASAQTPVIAEPLVDVQSPQPDPVKPNGMRELVLLVLQNHPELSQAEAESRVALSRVSEARSTGYPQLSFSSSYGQEQQKLYLSKRTNEFNDQAQAQLKLTQPLFDMSLGANLRRFKAGSLGMDWQLVMGGVGSIHNPTTVSFNDLQQSLRFQSTNSINGPLLIKYTGTELQDTQGRPIPSYTWMIGSDLPNQDYDNYQILNANRLTQAEQKAGVMILGGGGEDELTGGLGADTLVGGLDSDTLTGGLGSDTFVFAKDSGDIAGVTGDVIKDFNFGKTGGTNADTISLYQLFDSTVVSQLGKGASADATTLSTYLKLEWTKLDSNLQMVCSVDKDGRSNFSKLFTMTDLIGSVGSGTYQANQADLSLLNGTESTNALLQKMLEEGRLVVQ
jgi:hypothetical protein